MARIQILELPSEVVGDEVKPKFAIVIDELSVDSDIITRATPLEYLKDSIGAAGVIVTTDTLDIPANY